MTGRKKNNMEKELVKTPALESPAQARGGVFEGKVIKKFQSRAVIEFERTVKVPKYERFYKKHSKMHARIPVGIQIEIGDYVRIQECRPLSKIVHAIIIEKIRSAKNLEDSK